jgi:dolichyl-phosphate-mannose--protein O-mannosyl transferase
MSSTTSPAGTIWPGDIVDHGPIVAVQARLGELLFGDSVFGIRVLSAAAGAVMVFLGGMLAWAMGGGRAAQALAMFGLI